MESPIFYPDCDVDEDVILEDREEQKELEIEDESSSSRSSALSPLHKATSRPINIPQQQRRSRRGGFAQYSARRVPPRSNSSDADDEEGGDDNDNAYAALEHWVHYAYGTKTSFETALVNEVVRRRVSDQELAIISDSSDDEEIVDMMHAEESDRRHSWIKDMSRMYPAEFGDGHLLR